MLDWLWSWLFPKEPAPNEQEMADNNSKQTNEEKKQGQADSKEKAAEEEAAAKGEQRRKAQELRAKADEVRQRRLLRELEEADWPQAEEFARRQTQADDRRCAEEDARLEAEAYARRTVEEYARQKEVDARQAEADELQAELDARQAVKNALRAESEARRAVATARQAEADALQAEDDARNAVATARQVESDALQAEDDARRAVATARQAEVDALQAEVDARQAKGTARPQVEDEATQHGSDADKRQLDDTADLMLPETSTRFQQPIEAQFSGPLDLRDWNPQAPPYDDSSKKRYDHNIFNLVDADDLVRKVSSKKQDWYDALYRHDLTHRNTAATLEDVREEYSTYSENIEVTIREIENRGKMWRDEAAGKGNRAVSNAWKASVKEGIDRERKQEKIDRKAHEDEIAQLKEELRKLKEGSGRQ